MKTYRICDDHEGYKTLALDILDLSEQLGDRKLNRKIRSQPHKNYPLSPIWKKVIASYRDVVSDNSAVPDLCLWMRTHLVLSKRAYQVLNQPLSTEGEFLPISVDDEERFIFISLSFSRENESLTVKKFEDGIDMGLESLAFDEDDTRDKCVFKSLIEGPNNLYCSSKFVQLCREFSLKGLRFDKELVEKF
ncbi:hypothetical protein [Vibrio nigripulchritudo]|uniref:hypothetical protein n=1 Tax=Vibrio nigripulchritudo TaxID=28173 RepID=UPI0003B218CE|nr:hypothetical protein [Vibrio nigripulchritudo]CCN71473.1 hypothetical protein VIBNISFn118_380025 [Vibrio nigripulchritudo SFn118]